MKKFLRKKTKTGASLLVVLISVTLLIVMGTTFSIIAMSAYNNSHRRLCQQQAYYTAEACLNILSAQFASDPTGAYMGKIRDLIVEDYKDNKSVYGDKIWRATALVANLEEKQEGKVQIPSNEYESWLLGIVGGCQITASPVEGTPNINSISQIRIKSTGTYKGYSQTISARMGLTTNGALELKKIFSNSQTWCAPIVTLIAGETNGDMYFSSPGVYKRRGGDPNNPYSGEIDTTLQANIDLRKNVYNNVQSGNVNNTGTKVHTRPFGIDNKPLKTPATRCIPIEYVNKFYDKVYDKDLATDRSDFETNIIARLEDDTPFEGMQYVNYYVKDNYIEKGEDGLKAKNAKTKTDFGEFLGPNGEHMIIDGNWPTYERSPAFMSKYPQPKGNNFWYNDWVEIYMFSGHEIVPYTGKPVTNTNIINGDMYVNTQALIGLYDKDQTQVKYWPYRDVVTNRDKVERKFVSYMKDDQPQGNAVSTTRFADNFPYYRDVFRNGYEMGNNFEHGGDLNTPLFFDYWGTITGENGEITGQDPPPYNESVLSHNGNMYLFHDARIESYDSTHTPNANKGIKNNIFAHHNLVIDGTAMKKYDSKNDLMSGADWKKSNLNTINYRMNHLLTERNVSIFGDVMVEGDLMISNATIYGDVFVNGDNLYIADSEIYGNVYFNGAHIVTDNADIRGDEKTKHMAYNTATNTMEERSVDQGNLIDVQGNLLPTLQKWNPAKEQYEDDPLGKQSGFSFLTDLGRCIRLNGGDLIVLGNGLDPNNPKEKKKKYYPDEELAHAEGFADQETRFKADQKDRDMWGARLTNTSVHGTLFSEVNTAINSMFKSVYDYRDADGILYYKDLGTNKLYDKPGGGRNVNGGQIEDVYGNIVVDGCLFFDLQHKYRQDIKWANALYMATMANNAVRVTGICMSQRMQVVQTQFTEDKNFNPHLTRYEKDYVDGPWSFDDSTALADFHTHTEFSPYYMVERDTAEPTSPHFRCANVNIHCLHVGYGGLYMDGTLYYYKKNGNEWNTPHQDNSNNHSGIIIDEIYCTASQTGNYTWNYYVFGDLPIKPHPHDHTTASKVAVQNVAGKSKSDGKTYVDCKLYTPIAISDPKKPAIKFRRGPGHPDDTTATAFYHMSEDDIHKKMYNDVRDVMIKEIKGRQHTEGKGYTPAAKDTLFTSVGLIVDQMRTYYMKYKAPHRVNGYYNQMSKIMNYRGYKDLSDIRTWHNNENGEGPYQKYDENATDGVWRHIKVLEWKAPSKITPYQLTDHDYEADGLCIPSIGYSGQKSAINVTKLKPVTVVDESGKTDPRQYIYIDKGVPVISDSIKTDCALFVPDNCKLIFDTTNGNIHCSLEGGIIMGKNSQVVLRGGGMVFLYMTNEHCTTTDPDNVNNLILYMDKGAKMGLVEGDQGTDKANDSIYVVCNDATSLIHMKHMAGVVGYVYTPRGYLQIDEFFYDINGDGKDNDEKLSPPKGTNLSEFRKPYPSPENEVVRGSMIVGSFLIDMTIPYDDIKTMYKNLRYTYVLAPLIVDVNIDFDYGEGDRPPDDNVEYSDPNWGFVGYD